MRGKDDQSPTPHHLAFWISKRFDLICKDMDLRLPIFFLFLFTAQLKVSSMGKITDKCALLALCEQLP